MSKLPFPYTSAEQYEADLAQPVGKEWNARLAFDRLAMPDVIVRSGTYIAPIEYVAPADDDGNGTDSKKQKQKKQKRDEARKSSTKRRPKNV